MRYFIVPSLHGCPICHLKLAEFWQPVGTFSKFGKCDYSVLSLAPLPNPCYIEINLKIFNSCGFHDSPSVPKVYLGIGNNN